MNEKLKEYALANKNKVMALGSLIVTIVVFMWVLQKDSPVSEAQEQTEFGADIPAGYLVIPLELQNAKALSLMIQRHGVIDVFLKNQILARNLKIIKLTADEGAAFGALVPDKMVAPLQDVFNSKNLKGALRSHLNQSVQFFLPRRPSSLVTTYVTEENE